ncbi:WecB/TagA/CpsF family glycosyltransferase [Moheibacter sp.]|uniref:WecB/TagA/CpsF family glycosyltransferase n=1 Tax=Moheibacter sp. TaxID=1965316 RepID=UPI003C71B009
MIQRVPFLNTFYDNLTAQQTLEIIKNAIYTKQQIHHTVINANKVVLLQKDLELRNSVNSADIINIDGAGVLWGAKILGKPVKERVTGIDLMEAVLKMAQKENFKVYFLGAKEEIVKTLVDLYSEKYGENIISGYQNGYFNNQNEPEIVNIIAQSNPQILFVAMPSPKKENFLYKYRKDFSDINFIMGVGGSFDVLAGKVSRAPVWLQKMGMEWFYRLIQEPKKMWKRYLIGNLSFIYLILNSKIKK